jgi:hypothetical protein
LLASFTKLEMLAVSGHVSDNGPARLAELKSLQVFQLYTDQAITDQGLEKLERLTNLKVLEVAARGVTENGISRLKAVLPNCDVQVSWR